MSCYTRPKVPGACVFFTVNLVDRRADTLVRHVEVLRQAVAVTRAKRPFRIDAWVALPDHMHCVWTLPEGDAEFSGRSREIKGQFSMERRRSGRAPTPTGENPYGARGGRVRRVGVDEVRVGAGPEERVGARPDLRDEAPIWQKRFWEHHIRDDRDFAEHVRYCWINPVKHGLVDHPDAWPYSSWHRDGGGDLMR